MVGGNITNYQLPASLSYFCIPHCALPHSIALYLLEMLSFVLLPLDSQYPLPNVSFQVLQVSILAISRIELLPQFPFPPTNSNPNSFSPPIGLLDTTLCPYQPKDHFPKLLEVWSFKIKEEIPLPVAARFSDLPHSSTGTQEVSRS